MKHSKTYKNVKTSKTGLTLDYSVSVERLNECKFVVTGMFKKPDGRHIYNTTARFFKSANEAMMGYATMIKQSNKRFAK